jgi:hypothetical protein
LEKALAVLGYFQSWVMVEEMAEGEDIRQKKSLAKRGRRRSFLAEGSGGWIIWN